MTIATASTLRGYAARPLQQEPPPPPEPPPEKPPPEDPGFRFPRWALHAAPRVGVTAVDGAAAWFASAPPAVLLHPSLPGFTTVWGIARMAQGLFEISATKGGMYYSERHLMKGFGDLLAGTGLVVAASGSRIPGLAVVLAGDALATVAQALEAPAGKP